MEELQGEGGHVSFFPTILRSILKVDISLFCNNIEKGSKAGHISFCNNIEEYSKAGHISYLQQY